MAVTWSKSPDHTWPDNNVTINTSQSTDDKCVVDVPQGAACGRYWVLYKNTDNGTICSGQTYFEVTGDDCGGGGETCDLDITVKSGNPTAQAGGEVQFQHSQIPITCEITEVGQFGTSNVGAKIGTLPNDLAGCNWSFAGGGDWVTDIGVPLDKPTEIWASIASNGGENTQPRQTTITATCLSGEYCRGCNEMTFKVSQAGTAAPVGGNWPIVGGTTCNAENNPPQYNVAAILGEALNHTQLFNPWKNSTDTTVEIYNHTDRYVMFNGKFKVSNSHYIWFRASTGGKNASGSYLYGADTSAGQDTNFLVKPSYKATMSCHDIGNGGSGTYFSYSALGNKQGDRCSGLTKNDDYELHNEDISSDNPGVTITFSNTTLTIHIYSNATDLDTFTISQANFNNKTNMYTTYCEKKYKNGSYVGCNYKIAPVHLYRIVNNNWSGFDLNYEGITQIPI